MAKVRDKDNGWRKVAALAGQKSQTVQIGWPGGAGGSHGRLTNAELAAILHQERPFLDRSFTKNEGKWSKLIERGYKLILKGSLTIKGLAELLAVRAPADVKRDVVSGALGLKPNAPSTQARKGRKIRGKAKRAKARHVPLVDTGQLIGSIVGKVTEGK